MRGTELPPSGVLRSAETPPRLGIDVVVLARNEERVLAATLARLHPLLGQGDTLHVVADHCHDRTAHVAAAAGARVYLREGAGEAGKAQALRFWLDRTRRTSTSNRAVLILDADSSLSPDSLAVIGQLLESGCSVIQLPVFPRLSSQAPIPRLAAYSELIEHRVFERARARLGWPVRLRGTGMVFRRVVLEAVAGGLHTAVEDLELTLRVVDRGIAIAYAEGAWVIDPKPVDAEGVIRQRSRWFRGQLIVLRDYLGPVLRIAARGPPGCLLLYDALARPKALLLPLQLVAASAALVVAAATHSLLWAGLGLAMLVPVALDASAYLIGIRRLASPIEVVWAFAHVPAFMLAWVRSVLLALRTQEPWLRVRPAEPKAAVPDRQHVPGSF